MKISFQHKLAATVFALLWFSSTGAWAVCDAELAAHVSHLSGNTQFQNYLKKQHEYLLTVSERGVWNDQYFGQAGHKGNPDNYSDAERLAYANDRLKTAESAAERAWHIYALCMINSKSANNARTAQQQVQVQQAAQQQSQSAQQQSTQAQQLAQQNQARADLARKGKRRTHEPENEAHQCLTIDNSGPGFGSFVNKCNFKIAYSFCNYKPKKDSWADFHNCEGRAGNSDFIGPKGVNAAHVKNTETVYWFACKDPSWSLDTEYVPGQGLSGRCYTVGGN